MKHKKININISLPVSFLKEGNMFVAYSPALDLSTCGNTFEEASKNFYEALEIFFEECVEKNTLDEVLESLGWIKEKNNKWNPPQLIATELIPFNIPAFAS